MAAAQQTAFPAAVPALMAKRVQKVIYTVSLDPVRGRWIVTRNGVFTNDLSPSKDTAIGQAYRAASKEQATSGAEVTVWSIDVKGRRTKEWPT